MTNYPLSQYSGLEGNYRGAKLMSNTVTLWNQCFLQPEMITNQWTSAKTVHFLLEIIICFHGKKTTVCWCTDVFGGADKSIDSQHRRSFLSTTLCARLKPLPANSRLQQPISQRSTVSNLHHGRRELYCTDPRENRKPVLSSYFAGFISHQHKRPRWWPSFTSALQSSTGQQ